MKVVPEHGDLVGAGSWPAANGNGAGIWILRFDPAGSLVSQEISGDAGDAGTAVAATSDGGFVVLAFRCDSSDFAQILRFSASGAIEWEKAFANGQYVDPVDVSVGAGDAIFMTSYLQRPDVGLTDAWFASLAADGSVNWTATYGDAASSGWNVDPIGVRPAADGGALGAASVGSGETVLLRFSASGALVSQQGYAGATDLYGSSLDDDGLGGFLLAARRSATLNEDRPLLLTVGSDGVVAGNCSLQSTRVLEPQPPSEYETNLGYSASIPSILQPSATVVVAAAVVVTKPLCSESAPGEVSPPGSPQPLRFTSGADLTWETGAASGSDGFALLCGTVRGLLGGEYGSCLASGLTENAASDAALPAPREAFTYLVFGVNAVGRGPAGTRSDGVPRDAGTACP